MSARTGRSKKQVVAEKMEDKKRKKEDEDEEGGEEETKQQPITKFPRRAKRHEDGHEEEQRPRRAKRGDMVILGEGLDPAKVGFYGQKETMSTVTVDKDELVGTLLSQVQTLTETVEVLKTEIVKLGIKIEEISKTDNGVRNKSFSVVYN